MDKTHTGNATVTPDTARPGVVGAENDNTKGKTMKPKNPVKLLDTLRRRAAYLSSLKRSPCLGAVPVAGGVVMYTDGLCWLTLPAPEAVLAPASFAPPPEPFPSPEAVQVFEGRTPPELWDAIRAVLPACSTDKTRDPFQGAILNPPESGKPSCVCGVDGRRAHVIEIPHDLPERVCFGRPDSRLWLSFQAVAGQDGQGAYLVSWREPAPDGKTPGAQYWGAVWGAVVVTWRDRDCQAPNFWQVIPDRRYINGPHVLSPDTLSKARAGIVENGRDVPTILDMMKEGVLEAVEYVARARYSRETGGPAAEASIGFDARYLSDIADFIGGDGLEFFIDRPSDRAGMPDSWGPMLIERGARRAVLMPMRTE